MFNEHFKTHRRIRNSIITVIGVGLIGLYVYWQNANLQSASFSTGYVLFGSFVFLMLFNVRKRLPFLPQLGSSRLWMQAHIYVGWGTFAVFAMHIGLRIPNGMLETFLAILYLSVAFSGVYGLYITRIVPKKLTMIGDEFIYEQIPFLRKRTAIRAREIIATAIENSETLGRFYVNRLAPFLEKPRPIAYMVRPSTRQARQLQAEIRQLDRYMSTAHRELGIQLIELVRRKDNMDFHQAMQGRLKLWLFLHIGMTYSLLIVSIVHGVMAHAFYGGA